MMFNKTPDLTMAQKLKMLREINGLSQEELGQKLNVSDKTISAWETAEREINLNNAKGICELFNVPNSYFVFNENYEKVNGELKSQIQEYLKNFEFTSKIENIINTCKQKLENDGLPYKKEYIPHFDFVKQDFNDYGIFEKSSLPITIAHTTGMSFVDSSLKVSFDEFNLSNSKKYQYSSSALTKFGLYDILQRFNDDKVELVDLTNCNNLDLFKKTLEKMKNKKYTEGNSYLGNVRDVSTQYIQNQLNKVLEELNPNLSKYWEILVYLIDNGAFYLKQVGYGDDITCFNYVKDISKTNIIYRIAKDNLKK